MSLIDQIPKGQAGFEEWTTDDQNLVPAIGVPRQADDKDWTTDDEDFVGTSSNSAPRQADDEDWMPNPYQAEADRQIISRMFPINDVLRSAGIPVPPSVLSEVGIVSGACAAGPQAFPAGPAAWNQPLCYPAGVWACGTGGGGSPAADPPWAAASSFWSDESEATPGRGRKSSTVSTCASDVSSVVKLDGEKEPMTTLMIRNIPAGYSRSKLVEHLDGLGFRGEYDFVYLPLEKGKTTNTGYAFVNFVAPEAALRCIAEMAGSYFEGSAGRPIQIAAAKTQGLEKNVAHFCHTAVQCQGSQAHRPLVLSMGKPVRSMGQWLRSRLQKNRENRAAKEKAIDQPAPMWRPPLDA